MPALLRRRLGFLGRMALSVAWRCADGEPALPSVFASRHGELDRTVELLQSLARREPLSPTEFSLSVHNSAAGLFSIARRDRSPASAVAAGEDSLAAGMLEGIGLLADGQPQALVVYADADPPAPYRGHIGVGSPVFAVAILLRCGKGGTPCRLTRSRAPAAMPPESPERVLMGFLLGESARLPLGKASGWHLERVVGND